MDYPPANLTALKQIARGYQNTGSDCSWQEVELAIAEIERLRASQFRWIPVGERIPAGVALVWAVLDGSSHVHQLQANHLDRVNVTHWAPIPPLPEKSQADRDEELWEKSGLNESDGQTDDVYGRIRYARRFGFMQGLKAAREQKP